MAFANDSERRSEERKSTIKLPVFSDPTNKRGRILVCMAVVLTGFLIFWLTLLGHRLLFVPLTSLSIEAGGSAAPPLFTRYSDETLVQQFDRIGYPKTSLADHLGQPNCVGQRTGIEALSDEGRAVYAIASDESAWSHISLLDHCAQIDVFVPSWLRVGPPDTPVQWTLGTDHNAELTRRLLASTGSSLAVLPKLVLPGQSTGDYVDGPEDLDVIARAATEIAEEAKFEGLCIDITSLPLGEEPLGAAIVGAVGAALKARGMMTCVILSADSDAWTMPDIVDPADRVIVQMQRGSFTGSWPAPLAPQQWFVDTLAALAAEIPGEKLVVSMGTGGRDWVSGRASSSDVDYTTIMNDYARYGGMFEFFEQDLNGRLTYLDFAHWQHVVWMQDAVTFHNQLRASEGYELAGIAIDGLGNEDPGVWDVLATQGEPILDTIDRLSTVSTANHVRYEGEGVFRRVTSDGVDGRRKLTADSRGFYITSLEYPAPPRPMQIERLGQSDRTQLTLTFDDGPDPEFTNLVLDVLAEKQVLATFFVIGENILTYPELLRRITDEGHLLGVHTFSHAVIEGTSRLRVELELNATQRLIAAATGRMTLLYRTPYETGTGPVSRYVVQPDQVASEAGYLSVGADVVPRDWTDMTAQDLYEMARAGVRSGGSVIVLHDGGGDRTQTVEALGMMIDEFQANGYSFVTPAEMLGLTVSELMPPDVTFRATLDGATLGVLSLASKVLISVFWCTILLGLLRSATMMLLALRRKPRTSPPSDDFRLGVTVLVAAYNEEAVIERSIDTILASDYPHIEVLVIDDGSTDGTGDVIRKAFGHEPRVRLISKPNGGKWSALNQGISLVETDFVVAVDADTILRPDAITQLVAPFADPGIGAVSGNVKVGNRLNLLTRLQALEYLTTQNIDRRAFESIDGMMVVPGAIGAWRVAALREVGGYSNDTLAEDADLTVSIQRAGYRVRFAEKAISITEAPASLRPYLAQRLRWTLGMMQVGWKHRASAGKRHPIGLVSLPDLYLFGICFAMLAPIADLILVFNILDILRNAADGQPLLGDSENVIILAGYALLPLMDLAVALVALRMERRVDKSDRYSMLWIMPFQRIYYRQLLYFTVYRSVVRALTGRLAQWGKQQRMGTVGRPKLEPEIQLSRI